MTEMHQKQALSGIERRYLPGSEVRAVGDSGRTIRGYAATFGTVYDMGWFTEELSREALLSANMSDVRALFNHDNNLVLGRSKAGTVRVGVDQIGLWYEVDMPDTTTANDLMANIRIGNIDQSSWGFMLRVGPNGNGDRWERRNGKDHRTLVDVAEVFDVSPVTFPANPDTTVAKRSFELIQPTEPDKEVNLGAARLRGLDLDLRLLELEML